MSARFVDVDEWLHEAEGRLAEASTIGRVFFELPDAREATSEERAEDDARVELRAQWRRNTRAYRARNGPDRTLFHG